MSRARSPEMLGDAYVKHKNAFVVNSTEVVMMRPSC